MSPLQCQSCGAPMTVASPIPRDSECSSCGHALRSCTNCRHYDPAFNNSCRETEAEPVADKDRGNFCEYFDFNSAAFAKAAAGSPSADARAKLESLFGGGPSKEDPKKMLDSLFGAKPSAEDRAADARRKLDRLFGPKEGAPDDE